MRKTVNRYLDEDIREIGMWSMALLVNAHTWKDIKDHWNLICLVFLNFDVTDDSDVQRYSTILLSHIKQISTEENMSEAIQFSRSLPTIVPDVFHFDDDNIEGEEDEQEECLVHHTLTSTTIDKRIKSRAPRDKKDRLVNNPTLLPDVLLFASYR